MATKLFVDFDVAKTGAATLAPSSWSTWHIPPGVFHNNGVAAQDQTVGPPRLAAGGVGVFVAGRTANSSCYGGDSVAHGATFTPIATAEAAKLFQLAVKRSVWGIAEELYYTSDISFPVTLASSYAAGSYTQASSYDYLFKWGDLGVKCKSTTYDSTFATHTVVLAVLNAGTEVATVTLPGVVSAQWCFLKIHAKLDGSAGLIDVSLNGVAQSVAYTGQNTAAVVSLAAADHVYFGPAVFHAPGSLAQVGVIDNAYFSDTTFPTGRPRGERTTLTADSALSGWAAEGVSPTTLFNALSTADDQKSARGTGAGSSAILTLATYSTSGLNSGVIGWNLYPKKAANRDPDVTRGLSVGLTQSGTHNMGTLTAALTLPVDSALVPPAANYVNSFEGIYAKPGGAAYTTSDLATVAVRLLTF